MSDIPIHLRIAISELGVKEATGKNDGVPAERYMDGDRLAWCAGFVLYCFKQAGYPVPLNRWLARNVGNFESGMKDLGYWRPPNMVPMPGDIFFLGSRDGSDDPVLNQLLTSSGPGRHMGFVERVDLKKRVIHTIEGNYGNRVARAIRTMERVSASGRGRNITGYAVPMWRR